MSDDAAREILAAYAHEAWASWMRYLFANCGAAQHGKVVIPALYADALRRQMHTHYAELTEGEKDSDREEADKMISLVGLRIAALEAQLVAAQRANTAPIGRIVELEHALDSMLIGSEADAARIVWLEHEHDEARALLAAVRPVVAASVAMDETRPDALRFLRAVDAHEAATRGLGEGVRAWAREEARDVG